MIDPDDVRMDFQDFNPKINELVQLADFLIRYNIAQTGMPQALFAQEQDSNRSTLVQKIRLFMDGGLKNNQKEFTGPFAKQHYIPNFKAEYGKDSKEFKTFKVEAEFEPLKLEAFDDAVDAVEKLNKQFPLLPEDAGELLGIENFELEKIISRIGSNFMISFFGSMITFDFVTESPTDQIIFGSLLFSSVMTMLSLGYELRRYDESV